MIAQFLKNLFSGLYFYISYPFIVSAFKFYERREMRKTVPRVWLSSGELLTRDLELYHDDGRQKFDPKFLEDFSKARDDLLSLIKKQLLLHFLVFIFLVANYFKVGVNLSIGGVPLPYIPGVPEGLLLLSNLLACYTLILQGNSYLLDSAIKTVISIQTAPELRNLYLVRYFPHESFGAYQAFNQPHIIPSRFHRGLGRVSAWLFLLLLLSACLAYMAANFYLLLNHLWLQPSFGVWSNILFVYIMVLGVSCFSYLLITRFRLPYLDFIVNNELELLDQVDKNRYSVRLQEIYGQLNARRADLKRRGYIR